MSNVSQLPLYGHQTAGGGPLAGGSEPPHDDNMEHRVTALETRLDTILPTLATKADIGEIRSDLHRNDAAIKSWMVATFIALFLGFAGLFFTMTSSLRSGEHTTPQPQAPIVIQVPYPAQQSPTPPPSPHK